MNMVQKLPLDYTHFVWLDLIPRLFNAWTKDKEGFCLITSVIDEIGDRILRIHNTNTSDFSRFCRHTLGIKL